MLPMTRLLIFRDPWGLENIHVYGNVTKRASHTHREMAKGMRGPGSRLHSAKAAIEGFLLAFGPSPVPCPNPKENIVQVEAKR